MNKFILIFAVAFVGLLVVWCRYYIKRFRMEILFALTALILGLCMILTEPNRVGVSWDDTVHYTNTLRIANVFQEDYYKADQIQVDERIENIENHMQYDRNSREEYREKLEASYKAGEMTEKIDGGFSITMIAYIPSAVGILIARLFHMSYMGTFLTGKFFNLLLYIALFSLAIRKIKYGKVFLACIGLIPTSLFEAANYSYDPWMFGFIALGYAHLLCVLQEDNENRNEKDIWKAALFITIGCIPKAIYMPLLLPLAVFLFDKNLTADQKKKVWIAGIAGVVILAIVLVLPMITGGGYTDTRGGEDVNGVLQLKFILGHPMTYARAVINCFRDSFALESSKGFLQTFGTMEDGSRFVTVLVCLIVTLLLDVKIVNNVRVFKILSLIAFLCSMGLAATAMYIAYTPVGAGYVQGFQYRYMIQALIPLGMVFSSENITFQGNKKLLELIPVAVIGFVFMLNIWNILIIYY